LWRGVYDRFGKRGLDILVAGASLLLLSPLLIVVAVLVAVALGRPVLFRQERAGRGGRPFILIKFRSMRGGPGDDAARLTGFGRRLRTSALDELPQLLNVLRGEMSLVGPRPLPMAYVPLYSARQRLRLAVRPGLAGVAQAAGRNDVAWERRLELDAVYAGAPGASLRRDLRAIAGTVAMLSQGKGVAAPGHATMPAFTGGTTDPIRNDSAK
jgi:lipopolysaccharide/colanic/teichoic acid biosynthesis glycosyltransferase